MYDRFGQDARSDTPEAAACEFRGILGTGGSLQGQASGKDPDMLSQLRGLRAWAETRGELPAGEWLTSAVKGGAEHYIQHAPYEPRLIKITYPGQFGLRMRRKALSGPMPKQLADAMAL
jgi:hypothetical protein